MSSTGALPEDPDPLEREPAAGEDPPTGTGVGAVGLGTGMLVGLDGSSTGSYVPPPNSPLSIPSTE
jgi:hypothetical protein